MKSAAVSTWFSNRKGVNHGNAVPPVFSCATVVMTMADHPFDRSLVGAGKAEMLDTRHADRGVNCGQADLVAAVGEIADHVQCGTRRAAVTGGTEQEIVRPKPATQEITPAVAQETVST